MSSFTICQKVRPLKLHKLRMKLRGKLKNMGGDTKFFKIILEGL